MDKYLNADSTGITGINPNEHEQLMPPLTENTSSERLPVDSVDRTFSIGDAEHENKSFGIPTIKLTCSELEKDDDHLNEHFGEENSKLNPYKHLRGSHTSLLHWGQNPAKDDAEYLQNKYGELGDNIFVIDIPIPVVEYDQKSRRKLPPLGLKLVGDRDLNKMSVFVCDMLAGSVIEKDGRIEIGDQLLEVNDQVLYGLSHLNAAPIIRSHYLDLVHRISRRTKTESIRFVMSRQPTNSNAMATHCIQTHESFSESSSRRSSAESHSLCADKVKESLALMDVTFGNPQMSAIAQTLDVSLKRGEEGFGFAIMDRNVSNEKGIFIKDVAIDGTSSMSHKLLPGDQILRVNDKLTNEECYETVLEWIRSTKGQLRLQVSRLQCRGQHSGMQQSEKYRPKRFSAPQLLGQLVSVFRVHDIQHNRERSNQDVSEPFQSKLSRCSVPSGATLCPVYPNQDSLNSSKTPTGRPSIQSDGSTLNEEKENVENVGSCPKSPTSSDHGCRTEITQFIQAGKESLIELVGTQSTALGIGFVGGAGTSLNAPMVHRIYPEGTAAVDGRLKPGDLINFVNGQNLVGLDFVSAIGAINKAYNESVTPLADDSDSTEKPTFLITVFRHTETDWTWYDDVVSVELQRKSGKALGISISDRMSHGNKNVPIAPIAPTIINNGMDGEKENVREISNGVIISELVKGSVTALDGRLQVNDQILSVNDEDTTRSDMEQVGTILKATTNKVTLKIGRLKNQVISPSFHEYLKSTQ